MKSIKNLLSLGVAAALGIATFASTASAEAPSGVQVSHLGLNWKDTLKFQNAGYDPIKNPGKFERLLKLEQQFTTDSDCKPKEALGGCKALTEYQELKST